MLAKLRTPLTPRARLEWLQSVVVVMLTGLTLSVYQDVFGFRFGFKELWSTVELPVFAVVILPYITYVVVRSDPLRHLRTRFGPVKFYQEQFPSSYLVRRCESCHEEPACCNGLRKRNGDYVNYWFDELFHGSLEQLRPVSIHDTFEIGYTCKLVFASQCLLGVFAAFSLIIAAYDVTNRSILAGRFVLHLSSAQMAMPFMLFLFAWVIYALNKPDPANPTGCWAAWKEVNNGHRVWMRDHDDDLVRIVCHARGNGLTFRPR